LLELLLRGVVSFSPPFFSLLRQAGRKKRRTFVYSANTSAKLTLFACSKYCGVKGLGGSAGDEQVEDEEEEGGGRRRDEERTLRASCTVDVLGGAEERFEERV
jgi:hypothetical protein